MQRLDLTWQPLLSVDTGRGRGNARVLLMRMMSQEHFNREIYANTTPNKLVSALIHDSHSKTNGMDIDQEQRVRLTRNFKFAEAVKDGGATEIR